MEGLLGLCLRLRPLRRILIGGGCEDLIKDENEMSLSAGTDAVKWNERNEERCRVNSLCPLTHGINVEPPTLFRICVTARDSMEKDVAILL